MKKLAPEYVVQLQNNPLSATPVDVPMVDLSGLNRSPESRTSTVKAIASACATWGFFRIVNHGIEAALMEEMIKVAEEFHDLSFTEKMTYASDDVMSPIRYGTSLNSSKRQTLQWRDFLKHYGHPFRESFHLWPLIPPNYRIVAKEFLDQVWKLAMKVGGAISEGLGLDQRYIEDRLLDDGLQIMAANYYPPCPEPDKTLGLVGHSDHGAITILMDNGVNGLQVKHNGIWITTQNAPGTFVVNIGDTLEIFTNGKYKSVEHRAIVNVQKTRISVAVGHGPYLLKYCQPEKLVLDDGEVMKYQPILYKDYVRLQQSSTGGRKTALEITKTNNRDNANETK